MISMADAAVAPCAGIDFRAQSVGTVRLRRLLMTSTAKLWTCNRVVYSPFTMIIVGDAADSQAANFGFDQNCAPASALVCRRLIRALIKARYCRAFSGSSALAPERNSIIWFIWRSVRR
jgi:hypothetical protein